MYAKHVVMLFSKTTIKRFGGVQAVRTVGLNSNGVVSLLRSSKWVDPSGERSITKRYTALVSRIYKSSCPRSEPRSPRRVSQEKLEGLDDAIRFSETD